MGWWIGNLRTATPGFNPDTMTWTQRRLLTLKIGLIGEMAKLTYQLSSSPAPPQSQADAMAKMLLSQQLYSEIYHGASSDYGLNADNAFGLEQALAGIDSFLSTRQDNLANYQTSLSEVNQGSLAQRIAFLADTDYQTFRARELNAIGAKYAGAPPDGETVESYARQRNAEIDALPTVEEYYAARHLLLETAQQCVEGGGDLRTRITSAEMWQDSVLADFRPRRTAADKPFLNSRIVEFLYQDYLRGATGRTGDEYYWADRYNQVNMAYPYLQGWADLCDVYKAEFADYLSPDDRDALLVSLSNAGHDLANAGNLELSQTARDMAAYIRGRLTAQMAEHRVDYGLAAGWIRLYPGEAKSAQYYRLPDPLRNLLDREMLPAFQRFFIENYKRVGQYQPVYWWTWLDRTILTLGEFAGPAYRSFQRVKGLVQGAFTGDFTRVDELSNLAAIQDVISNGFTRRQLNPSNISYDLGNILIDGAFTALTVYPFAGAGPRAVLLPSMGRQVISGARAAFVTVVGGMLPAAVAMTAVDMMPLPDEIKGTLRLIAGLSFGVAGGYAANRYLPSFQYRLVAATQRWEALEKTLDEFAGDPTMRAALVAQRDQAMQAVMELRAIGGPELEAQLIAAETRLATAGRDLASAEARLNAAGLASSARARLLGQARATRAAVRSVTGDLAAIHDQIERAANAAGLAPTRLFGHNEYEVANAAQAARVRRALEAYYNQYAPPGATIRWVDNVPGGRNGFLDTVTGDIRLSNDLLINYPHWAEGLLMEELQHFHQLQSRGWIGRALTDTEEALIELQVVRRMRRSGFRIFDPRRP
ncbi:MAG: hypothetical protein U0793_18030 [Gemmataceae bacterium]